MNKISTHICHKKRKTKKIQKKNKEKHKNKIFYVFWFRYLKI